jgi:hypothetical protein
MAVRFTPWRWLERLAPRLYHEGRFCPHIAYKRRRVRGPVDWLLLILVVTIIALGVYGGTLYYAGE